MSGNYSFAQAIKWDLWDDDADVQTRIVSALEFVTKLRNRPDIFITDKNGLLFKYELCCFTLRSCHEITLTV